MDAAAIEALGRGWLDTFGVLNLWMLAALAVVALADRLLARRVSAGWRMAMYAVVFLRLFAVEGLVSPFGLLPGEEAAAASGTMTLVAAEQVADVARASVVVVRPTWSWGTLVLAVHLLVAGTLLWRLVRGHRRVAAIVREANVVVVPGHGALTLVHPEAGPLATGILRPRVVLPPSVLELPPTQRDAVVRHERAHLRHRDPLLQAALATTCALAWPVLAVWLAASRLRVLMELRADEQATQPLDRTETKAYGQMLLRIASTGGFAAPALGLGHGQLAARLRALGRRRRASVATQAFAVGLAATTSFVLIAQRADETPEVIPMPDEPETIEHEEQRYDACVLDQAVLRPEGEGADEADERYEKGVVAAARGDLETAEQELQEAAWLAASVRYDYRAAASGARLVEVMAAQGEYEEALAWSLHAQVAFRRLPPVRAEIRFRRAMADVLTATGRAEGAAAAQAEADRLAALCP